MQKITHPVDRHVGARVRVRRILAGISQVQLGAALGVTYQQVQKYEKGANRISASRLQQISGVLGVPVDFFFQGAPAAHLPNLGVVDGAEMGDVASFLSTSEGAQMATAFPRIANARVRRRILDLVEALADGRLGEARARTP